MGENIVFDKSISFSIRIINLYKYLKDTQKEFVLSKQLLKSGTAIGALLSEGAYAQSKPDFINKYHVAVKEANECRYWLLLLFETKYLDKAAFSSMNADCEELIKIIVASIKTAKSKLNLK